MTVDQENLERKHIELAEAYKNKVQKCLRAQELYDRLKHKAMLGQVQDAASESVNYTLGTATGKNFGGAVTHAELAEQQGVIPYHDPRHDGSLDAPGATRGHVPGPGINSWQENPVVQGLSVALCYYEAG